MLNQLTVHLNFMFNMKAIFCNIRWISLCLLCLFASELQSQEEYISEEEIPLVNFAEFTLDPVVPLYSFGDLVDKNLFGFSLAYLRQRKRNRIDYFGGQLSYAHIGSITQSFIDFEDRTSSEIINLKFLYRYFPNFFFWRVEPFLELGFGPQVIYTFTTTTSFLDDTASLNFESSDFGLAYHACLGFTTHITGQVFFLTKFSFNGGTSMSYYVPGEYVSGLPFDNFFRETSSVNFIQWQLGLTVSF